ncbi:MAG: enoyl-CoA hydratase [Pseudomonadota bacterium]
MTDTNFYLNREDISHERGKVCVFTVHGRTKINLVGREALASMVEVIDSAAQDETIRCAILQGKDEEALIGGADLKELGALERDSADEFVHAIHLVCDAIRRFPVPVIGRLRGYCLGGGLEIAAACDFRVADETAKCGMPEVKVGVPSVVEAALLPQLVGWGKTRELVYRGNIIDAAESARIGLVEQLAEDEDIDAAIAACVTDILEAAPGAIRIQKKLCAEWERQDIDTAISSGLTAFKQAYQTDEPARYVAEFFERNRKK